jgi:hypothetical protein
MRIMDKFNRLVKQGYLNVKSSWLIRAAIFLIDGIIQTQLLSRKRLAQDLMIIVLQKRTFKLSVASLYSFIVSESIMAWD